MKDVFKLLAITLICSIQSSCGVKENVEYQKDFQVYIDSEDPTLVNVMRDLTDDFNDQAGREAINIVDRVQDSNSSIEFTEGLLKEYRYLGYGSGIKEEIKEGPKFKGLSIEQKSKVIHSMQLQFDADNFSKRAYSLTGDDGDSQNWDHLYHLFCHEVGHGLLLQHDASSKYNVMHPVINSVEKEDLKYEDFFRQVNDFFKN